LTTLTRHTYTPKKFDLAGLQGISDRTLELHYHLYEGYVEQTNLLTEQLAEHVRAGKAHGDDPFFAELTRRLGFEYNGMVLHEYYFGNMTRHAGGSPASGLRDVVAASHGDFDTWKKDFSAIGGMRGAGWAIAYYDPHAHRVSNHWITLHEDGNVAGFVPLLVMDVWEHAFLLDYKPSERAKYIEAFFANVDWKVVQQRLDAASVGRAN
jgi:Fe-Mn family superoxide dismutase